MARAERPRGTCSVCGKDCAITDEGGVRHHFTEDPDQQAGPDSRKCRGVGQPPAGAAPAAGDIRFLCRVPSGPGGCGHAVQLTSNHRARSHLTPHGEPCAEGGSAWPIAVGPDGFRQDTAEWTEADWDRALPRPVRGGEILQAVAPEDLRIEPDDPVEDFLGTGGPEPGTQPPPKASQFGSLDPAEDFLDADRREPKVCTAYNCGHRLADHLGGVGCSGSGDSFQCRGCREGSEPEDPHAREADIAIAEAERIQREQDRAYEQALRDGLEDQQRQAAPCDHDWGGADVLNEEGDEDQVTACNTCGLIMPEDGPTDTAASGHPEAPSPFDPTHTVTTDLGPEVHPGEAAGCCLPGCCTHPRGFEYGDDDNGHSGSFCRVCGVEEPEPCTHPGERVYGGTDEEGADVWVCEACGEREDPAVTRMKAHRRARDILDNLDEGVLFVRHTARPPLDRLVYRVKEVRTDSLDATVVSAGPYAGRTGTLTDLSEEITCTDLDGKPRARRALRPTPSRPAPTTPSRTPDRSSRPSGPGSARSSSAGTSSSTPATSSGPSAAASTSTRTATRSGSVPDAFSTPKQAASESDKYDRYGRYKLLHPDTGKAVNWTRATTFAKSVQDTYALSMWSQRMTLKGAALRSDITAAVCTLDVKKDKDRVNSLVEDAKKAAGDKVAANKGTAVHAFTEDRDKALVGEEVEPREVPEEFAATVDAYEAILREFGLEPVPGLIEFTTAVKQYEVAGTSDRVYRVTRNLTLNLNGRTITLYAGEYVIGDVKTGADLSYGWQEIAIQLALYAQGLNTSGVWDWRTRQWARPVTVESSDVQLKVRTDVGIVPHLPVDREEGAPLATLYAIDLDAGWAAAVLCGQVRSWRKERKLATPLEVANVEEPNEPLRRGAAKARTVVSSRPATLEDKARAVTSRAEASSVFQEAKTARVSVTELNRLIAIMQAKLESFVEQGA